MGLIQQWRGLTPALAQQSPQASALEAAAPGDAAEALSNLLTFAAAQFNVGKNFSDVQIALLASEMLRKYWYWRFDEFSLVLREAVAGCFGTTYDRLDAPTVHAWCATYEQERTALAIDAQEHEARRLKQAEAEPVRSELTQQPGYAALRATVEALCDEQLQAGIDYYATLPTPTPEQELKLGVANEVAQERNRQVWATHLLRQFQASGHVGETQAERQARHRAEDRAMSLALLRGDWQAAGLACAPPEWQNATPPEPTGNVYPPACPHCLQRPDQCICPPALPACPRCLQRGSACRCEQTPF